MSERTPGKSELTTQVRQVSSRPVAPTRGPKPSAARQTNVGLPTMDLVFFLGILRKYWLWLLPLGLLSAGLACAGVLAFFKPVYEARYRLEVDLGSYVVFKNEVRYTSEFVELQKAILLGNDVLREAIATPLISSVERIADTRDPIGTLRQGLKVSPAAGYRLIDVKFVDEDPKTAADVVNTVVEKYLIARKSMENRKSTDQEKNVANALKMANAAVDEAKGRVRTFSMLAVKDDTLVGERESGRIDTTFLDNMRMSRMQLSSQLTIMKVNQDQAIRDFDRDFGEGSVATKPAGSNIIISEEALDSDLVVSAAKNQWRVAEQQLMDLEAGSNIGEKNPVYIAAKRKIEMLQAEYDRVREGRRKELTERNGRNSIHERRLELEKIQAQIEELTLQRSTVEEQMRAYLAQLQQSNASGIDLQFAEADLEEWNQIRATIHNRSIQLQTERDALETVQRLEVASPPKFPVEDLPYKQLGLASLIGFLVPFGLAVLLELRSRKVDNAGQLESRSHLSVLGEISSIPVQSSRRLVGKNSASRELRLFEESVDSLCTTLILKEDLRDARVFAVSSALSGEGKTSVSCQLAVSIARATGKRVLLIDGDMRSPDVHNVFGRDNTEGLVGFLSGTCRWQDVVDRDWSEMVHLLPAGWLRGSPHRLLNGGGLEELIQEARQEYDFVLIDTPPVLSASEALLFAKSSDVCLICALRDRSRIEQLIQAYHRLEAAGVRVAGSVLSGVPVREYANYYGDYYATKA